MVDLDRAVRKAALEDALERGGQARWDIVLDRVQAELRHRAMDRTELRALVRLKVAEVNELGEDGQRSELQDLGGQG